MVSPSAVVGARKRGSDAAFGTRDGADARDGAERAGKRRRSLRLARAAPARAKDNCGDARAKGTGAARAVPKPRVLTKANANVPAPRGAATKVVGEVAPAKKSFPAPRLDKLRGA